METQDSTLPTEPQTRNTTTPIWKPTRLSTGMPTLEELRSDPACEARRGIADRIGCRECGEFFPVLSGKNGHLSAEHHLTSDEYSARYVGARLVSFDYYAYSHRGYEAQKLMAKLAEDYATPEVRAECEKDPQYEEKRELEFKDLPSMRPEVYPCSGQTSRQSAWMDSSAIPRKIS